jgi:hypothetical protein
LICFLERQISKTTEKSIDMFARTDGFQNGLQTSILSTRAMLSAWC